MNQAVGRGPLAAALRSLAACLLLAGALGAVDAQAQLGGLRFVHLAADAPLVDVLIDGRAVLRDVAFGDVTGYVPTAGGRHQITVVPHRLRQSDMDDEGEQADGTQIPVRALQPVTTFASVRAGSYHTAVLTGFYEPPAEDRQLGHLSIAVTPAGTPFRISGPRGYAAEFTGDQLVTGVEPGAYTITADREGFRPATYDAEVRPRQTTTVSIALQEAEDGAAPSEGLVGPAGDSETWASLQVQTFDDEFGEIPPAGVAKIRIVHASPTSPDLYVVAEPAAGGTDVPIELGSVTYPSAGSFVMVPAGRYVLRFGVLGSRRSLVDIQGLELRGGTVYTFFLASEITGSRSRIVPIVDATVVWDEREP